MNNYVLGTRITLQGSFTSVAGAPVDPTTVVAKVLQPDGVIVDLTPTKTTTGNYEVDWVPVQEGLHTYRFAGTGTCIAADEQTFMTRSAF